MKTAEIRQAFLSYFADRGHEVVPSSSLVPHQDPTLLFTNAGMVQFKEAFLGIEKLPYTCAASVQKCVRAGGKHNDLENVGYTARHHTLFEMLGFFSFGAYFKRQAIQFAWEFLTQVLKLPEEKLWVTVYKDDDEAAEIWLKEIGVSAERFSRCDEDNFWAMGDTGPCGPCTEIFYDHGPKIPGGPPGSADADGDRYIEIWNLVFMQYNRDKAGQLHPLPEVAVDTGMGLERLAAVVQGVHSNYEIDDFQTLLQAIKKQVTQAKPSQASMHVIADHLRSCAFLVADGILPSNEGRGYVLRRIIRRAVRHAHYLGIKAPFFSTLLPTLVQVMGEAYPDLKAKQPQIAEALTQEEAQFAKTLEQGLNLLKAALKNQKEKGCLAGKTAFKLYDTYGFPLDLTEDILREQNWQVDRAGFEKCMEAQRTLSQASAQFSAKSLPVMNGLDASLFEGYTCTQLATDIVGISQEAGALDVLKAGQCAWIALKATPFYAESGGQVGDTGQIETAKARFEVLDTQRQGNLILHYGEMKQGQLKVGEKVDAKVNAIRRQAIALNHSATHLLHAALKSILGQQVEQRGSLVEATRARFDFSYPKALSPSELQAVEQQVNAQIRANHEVQTQVMSLDEAKRSGAVALFGEKYTGKVRVLTMGDFSKELCGGTHVQRTGDIGYFRTTAEYGVASGVRRIELVTGEAAEAYVDEQMQQLYAIASHLKTNPAAVENKVLQLLNDMKEREKQTAALEQKLAQHAGSKLEEQVKTVNGIQLLIASVEGAQMQGLRGTLDKLRTQLDKGIIVLYSIIDGRFALVVGMSQSLVGRFPSAPQIAKMLCDKAGGRDDMAQGGGEAPSDLQARIARVEDLLEKHRPNA